MQVAASNRLCWLERTYKMKLTLVLAMLVLTGKTTAQTKPTNLITPPGCVHGKTYPHRYICQHYYRCYRGWFALETCNFGLVYSRSLKLCVSIDSPDNDCKRNEIEMQQIEITTTGKPSTTYIDWQFTTLSTTITKGNEIEMQQIETTAVTLPDTNGRKTKMHPRKRTPKGASRTTTEDSDWQYTTESTTTTEGNEIEMQQIEITTDTLPDITKAKDIQPMMVSSICVHDETYFYPSNCHLYYLCYYGLLLIEKCSTDLVYSRSAKQCVSTTSLDNDCDWDELEMQQIEITTTEKQPTTDIDSDWQCTTETTTTTEGNEIEMQQIETTTDSLPGKTKMHTRKRTPKRAFRTTTEGNEIEMQEIETTESLPDTNGRKTKMHTRKRTPKGASRTTTEGDEMEMQQIEITTTEKPTSDIDSDWQFTTESTTTTECNEIEMQEIETTDSLPDTNGTKDIQVTLVSSICVHGETSFYPSNCSLYYLCYYGLMLIEKCSTDLVYSRSAKQCVSTTSLDNDCDYWPFTNRSTTTTQSNEIEMQQIEITTDILPDVTDGKNNKTQRFNTTTNEVPTTTKEAVGSRAQNCTDHVVNTDEKDCRKYYYCNRGKLEHRTCFLNYVFSRRLKHCVPRYSHYADCEQVVRVD